MEKVEDHILKMYEVSEFKGKGAYGIVWKAKDKQTQQCVALKKVFDAFQNATDAQRTFREVVFLQQLTEHDNIVKLIKVLPSENQKDLYMVFEYMDTDLHKVIRAGLLNQLHMQYIIYQLLKCLKYIHSGDLIHRDLKPSNLLIDTDCKVKVADFGLARSIAQSENQDEMPVMTEYVATRWYRAPEILLGSHNYSKAVDMWSVGCILGEMLQGKAIFSGASTMNQIEKVIELIGRPKPEDLEIISAPMAQSVLDNIQMQKKKSFAGFFPNASPDAVDFIRQCLDWNPHKRINVEQALRHPLMKEFANTEDEKTLKNIIKVPFNDNKKFSIKDYRDKIHNGCQVLQELNKTKEIKQYNSQPSTIQNYLQNYEAKRVEKMKTEQTTKVDVSIEKKPSTSQTKLDQSPQPKKPIQTYSQLLQQKYIQNTKKPSISKPVVQYESKSPELKKRDQPTQPVTKSFSFHTEGNEKRPVSSNKPYETKPNISSNAIKYTGTSQSFHQPKEKPIIQTQVQSQAIRSKSFEKSPLAVGPASPFGRQKTALEKPKFGVQSNLKTNQDIPNSISQVQKLLQRCSQLSNNYVHKKTVTHYTEPSRPPYHTVNYNYFDIRNSKFM